MDYIDDWNKYNVRNELDARNYVENNLYRLIQLFNIEDDFSTEEKAQFLQDYFTKFPDQMQRISMDTSGLPKNFSVPILNNIGGVVKYR